MKKQYTLFVPDILIKGSVIIHVTFLFIMFAYLETKGWRNELWLPFIIAALLQFLILLLRKRKEFSGKVYMLQFQYLIIGSFIVVELFLSGEKKVLNLSQFALNIILPILLTTYMNKSKIWENKKVFKEIFLIITLILLMFFIFFLSNNSIIEILLFIFSQVFIVVGIQGIYNYIHAKNLSPVLFEREEDYFNIFQEKKKSIFTGNVMLFIVLGLSLLGVLSACIEKQFVISIISLVMYNVIFYVLVWLSEATTSSKWYKNRIACFLFFLTLFLILGEVIFLLTIGRLPFLGLILILLLTILQCNSYRYFYPKKIKKDV